ncbi:DUF2577 family protein [Neobacillus sp. PS3-40]|uniref:DUF2577 family protein n=1 Tax=Neobacillus sp. PS3-40 TaxID=3070679 RepID=UPI0027DF972D|nr:hypothetical protein [Neobacillus sp. PS3-40]WML42707.1 hypothetical protein RCG20_12735 [Neobacillus sp. PS3-40]
MSIAELAYIIRKEGAYHNSPLPFLGEVSSVDPLKIKTHGIELDDDQFYIVQETEFRVGQTVILFPMPKGKFVAMRVIE